MKESSSYKWIVLGNIMIGTFMAVLDSTVVNTGLPVIMARCGYQCGRMGADRIHAFDGEYSSCCRMAVRTLRL